MTCSVHKLLRLVALCGLCWLGQSTGLSASEPSPPRGRPLDGFSLHDLAGQPHAPQDWRQSVVVFFFLATECPVCNGYVPEINRLAEAYASRGVTFYIVHSDPTTTAKDAADHAREYSLALPVLLDPQQALAQQAGIRITPEAALVLRNQVVYHGRIDDRYALNGKRRDEPRVRDLQDAIEAVLDGKQPAEPETKAFGCPLPRIKAVAGPPQN